LHIAAESGNDTIMDILLYKGADIYAKDNNRQTAADLAKSNHHRKIHNFLKIKSGSDQGLLSLINAIEDGKFEMAKTLLNRGVDVNTKDENGQTALHAVSESGDKKGVMFLSTIKGIEIEKEDNSGKTAADLAKSNNHREIYNFLHRESKIRSGSDRSGGMISREDFELLKTLCTDQNNQLDKGLLRSITGMQSLLSLINAIERGEFKMAKTLLNGGVDVNTKDENGQTALHVVSESGDKKGVNFLLTIKGIEIEEKDNSGKTAADLAKSNHPDIYNFLVNEQKRRLIEQVTMSNSSGSVTANTSGSVVEAPSGSVVVTETENAQKLSGKSELTKGK